MSRQMINILKWVSGGMEALLGIPVLGGTIILSMAWVPLFIMLAFHIIIVVFSYKAGIKANGNILGIVTSVVGFIPGIGMIMHLLSAVFILVDAAQNQAKTAV
ncbi:MULTISPECIES: hypothetical protein [Bacillaceae]|uniref:hypothetical protein n=1 Tax=Bacillaceae TaxID=186817 RepID=UPI000A93705D|nr:MULTISPECIES: hypothetical protein [Bacillaceae]